MAIFVDITLVTIAVDAVLMQIAAIGTNLGAFFGGSGLVPFTDFLA